jgi:hypothetical protein
MKFYYEEIINLLFFPKLFFKDNVNCNWKKPFYFYFIFSLFQGIFISLNTLSENNNSFPDLIYQPVIINLGFILILVGLISFQSYILWRYQNYWQIFKVFLFTQLNWFLFVLISGVFGKLIFNYSFGHLDILLVLWYLYQLIGLSWVFHTIIIGISISTGITLKNILIPAILPFFILSILYLWNIGFFQFFLIKLL